MWGGCRGERVALVATGALTNVALLLILYPEVGAMVDITLMGGAMGMGNTGPVQEFNIQVCPCWLTPHTTHCFPCHCAAASDPEGRFRMRCTFNTQTVLTVVPQFRHTQLQLKGRMQDSKWNLRELNSKGYSSCPRSQRGECAGQ